MAREDIRIVEMGDGTVVWLAGGDGPDRARRRRRWPLWAACGVGVAALAAAALELVL
jgi:hypothetical protein